MTNFMVRGEVVKVLSGNTLILDLDLGWHQWVHLKTVRLVGVKRASKEFLESMCPIGSKVDVTSYRLDDEGVATVALRIRGEDLSYQMLIAGLSDEG